MNNSIINAFERLWYHLNEKLKFKADKFYVEDLVEDSINIFSENEVYPKADKSHMNKFLEKSIYLKDFSEDLFYFWDFRTGSSVDQIQGAEAIKSDNITLDENGASLTSNNSYISIPGYLNEDNIYNNMIEIKFGEVALQDNGGTQKIIGTTFDKGTVGSSGIMWYNRQWTGNSSMTTEFTDITMLSGKTVYGRGVPYTKKIDWYCEDQYLYTTEREQNDTLHTRFIIGGSTMGPKGNVVVEYVKIYPSAGFDMNVIDEVELIAIDDIDAICGTTIQMASEVTF